MDGVEHQPVGGPQSVSPSSQSSLTPPLDKETTDKLTIIFYFNYLDLGTHKMYFLPQYVEYFFIFKFHFYNLKLTRS